MIIGDLKTFVDDISDLMVKCFSQLILQTPVIATLLSLIFKSESSFSVLVLQKLVRQLTRALKEGDIILARNHLRACASLASAGSLHMSGGEGSMIQLLSVFVDEAEREISHSANNSFNVLSQSLVFLIGSTIPYIADALKGNTDEATMSVLSRCLALCRKVCQGTWSSPYDVHGPHSLFHAQIEGTTAPSTRILPHDNAPRSVSPQGAVCWDNVWEVCCVAEAILSILVESNEPLYLPSCLVLPWTLPELEDSITVNRTPVDEDEDAPHIQSGSLVVLNENDNQRPGTYLTFHEDMLNSIRAAVGSSEMRIKCSPAADYCPIAEVSIKASEANGYAAWMAPRFNTCTEDMGQNSIAAITNLSLVELVTARDYFRTIIRFFEPYIRDDGTRVGSFELISKHLMSVFQFFPEDSHLEYVLVETLLLMVVQLPALNENLVHRLLLDLCRHSSSMIPQAIVTGT